MFGIKNSIIRLGHVGIIRSMSTLTKSTNPTSARAMIKALDGPYCWGDHNKEKYVERRLWMYQNAYAFYAMNQCLEKKSENLHAILMSKYKTQRALIYQQQMDELPVTTEALDEDLECQFKEIMSTKELPEFEFDSLYLDAIEKHHAFMPLEASVLSFKTINSAMIYFIHEDWRMVDNIAANDAISKDAAWQTWLGQKIVRVPQDTGKGLQPFDEEVFYAATKRTDPYLSENFSADLRRLIPEEEIAEILTKLYIVGVVFYCLIQLIPLTINV